MTITVTKSNTETLTTVEDGINDDSTSSINLLGRNYVGYAEPIADNFVHLMEHFANDTAPTNPLPGQLWYDTSASTLNVYDATVGWSPLALSATGTSAPANPKIGDLWFDSTNQQLNVWTGSAWLVVGPPTPSGYGKTGIEVAEIIDTLAVTHIVAEEYIDGNLISIISQDAEFQAANATLHATFGNIKSGYNLTGSLPIKNFNGIAADSNKFGGLLTTNFLRANTPALTTSSITVQSDTGVTIGQGNDLTLSVSDIHARIKNNNTSGNISLITGNTTAITIDGTTYAPIASSTYGNAVLANANAFSSYSLATIGYVDALTGGGNAALLRDGSVTITGILTPQNTNQHNLGSASLRFATFYTSNANVSNAIATNTATVASSTGSTSTTTGALVVTGGTGIGGNLNVGGTANIAGITTLSANLVTRHVLPTTTNTYNIGTSSNKYLTIYANTFSGTATMSQYADLAEMYTSDAQYGVGTVLMFGGQYEVTISTGLATTKVAGLVSDKPGLLMNSDGWGVPVALQGKVKCKVTGKVEKGQMLMTSEIPGVAKATDAYIGGAVFAKSLESVDFAETVGLIDVVVGVS